ncbi:MAG: transcription termination/antitermination protein NusG [Terriglobales bacterium]
MVVVPDSSCESEAGCVADAPADSTAWWVAYTKPRHEERVRQYWDRCSLETYLPRYQSWRVWSDRRVVIQLPLFPRYVFVRLARPQSGCAVQAPGFLGFVRNAMGPVEVHPHELYAIRDLLASGLQWDPLPNVEVGDEVEITNGALRGCRGKLLRKDRCEIALVVGAINGGVRIKVPDPSWLAPVLPTGCARRHAPA